MSTLEIPVIDLAPYFEGNAEGKAAVGRAVDKACSEIGFLVISGHRVDASLIERMRSVSLAYFDLPIEQKMRLRMPPDRYRGYTPMAAENLAATLGAETPPDLKESFSIGPIVAMHDEYHTRPEARTFFADNLWPAEPEGMRETWSAYYKQMESLASTLMRVFALALDMPENYFDGKVDRHISNFSVIHYPQQNEAPKPGQLRAGAHTDYGSLTILYKDDAPGGLQVQTPAGDWIAAPHHPGTFIVNLGDLMQDWTNHRWRSTLHRVVNPPREAGASSRRLSMPFFHQPNYDTVVECIPTCCSADNPPKLSGITSGDHVLMKIGIHRQGDGATTAAA